MAPLRTLAVLGGCALASAGARPRLTKPQAQHLVSDFTAKGYHIPSWLMATSKDEEEFRAGGKPEAWDDEEDGAWEPIEWEKAWWTAAGEEGVNFIEYYDIAEKKDMNYRDDGFRYRILETGNTGLQAYGPLTDCKILGAGWTSENYPLGQPYIWEKNRKKPYSVRANNIMSCFESAMNYMEIGSTWEFVCTPELGYAGATDKGVPANTVFIFRIELLSCSATRDLPRINEEPEVEALADDDDEDELGFGDEL